ncbi:class I SAM-dependent methyltransferase [Nonomuraea lactucae]|uniref:class I SAM-dependent methyltransferase n=1 Tax=Nonomuraea lactucae TaxID=2249762 RepID=UPI000DE2BEAE|nr:class I SAM-dependent methyltransferase [Nonomuraea lactucae]
MAQFPEIMHRAFFRTISLLSQRGQGEVLRRYFDWWHRSPDPWRLGSDGYEQLKYATTLGQVPARPYERILEVGCSEGVFTRLLASAHPQAEIMGIDISHRALLRARDRVRESDARTALVQADIVTFASGRPFDLVFCAETLYYVGRHDRLRRASARLTGVLAPGGVLVMVHPWPEAERLHRFVDSDRALSRIGQHVNAATHRPFSVAVYRHAGEPVSLHDDLPGGVR